MFGSHRNRDSYATFRAYIICKPLIKPSFLAWNFMPLMATNAIIRRIPEKSILLTHHLTDTVTREIKSGRHSILCGHQWHEVPSQKRRFDEGFADYICSKCRITVSVTVRTEHIFKQNKICNECGKLDPYTEYHIIKGTVYDICEKCHNHLEIKYEYNL